MKSFFVSSLAIIHLIIVISGVIAIPFAVHPEKIFHPLVITFFVIFCVPYFTNIIMLWIPEYRSYLNRENFRLLFLLSILYAPVLPIVSYIKIFGLLP
jgi:hypothetical protein